MFHVTELNKNILLTERSNNEDDTAGTVKQGSAPLIPRRNEMNV